MKCNDRSEKYINVEKRPYLSEALEGFYCQTEELSTLVISTKTASKKPPRKVKHSENCFKQFLKIGSATVAAYKILKENLYVTEAFLPKLQLIRVMLGAPDCIYLLNPAYFLCHVDTCKKNC